MMQKLIASRGRKLILEHLNRCRFSSIFVVFPAGCKERMALRVGITGVSGDVGRGAILGLRRNRPSDEPIHLIGLDAGTKPLELGSLGSFVQLPRVADAGYVEALISTFASL